MGEIDPRTFIGETNEDLQNEIDVIEQFCAKFNCGYIKMDKYERVDFVLYRGEKHKRHVVAIAEVKCRHDHNFKDWGDIMCPLHKKAHCVMYAEAINVPAMLISKHNDGIFYCDMREPFYDCRILQDPRRRGVSDDVPCVTWKGDVVKELK